MSDPISLHVQLGPDFEQRYDAAFARLQKEADAEWVRLVKPYIPKRTGALVGSTDTHTVLGSGHIVQATPYAAAQYYRLPLGQGVTRHEPHAAVAHGGTRQPLQRSLPFVRQHQQARAAFGQALFSGSPGGVHTAGIGFHWRSRSGGSFGHGGIRCHQHARGRLGKGLGHGLRL